MTGVKRLSGRFPPLSMDVNTDPAFPDHVSSLSACGCIPPAEGVFYYNRTATHHDGSGYPMHASTHQNNELRPLDGAPGQADRDTLLHWYGLMHLGRALDDFIAATEATAGQPEEATEGADDTAPTRTSCAGCEGIQLALGLHVRSGSDILFPRRGDLVTALAAGLSPDDILLTALGKATAPGGGGRGARDLFANPDAGVQHVAASEGSRARHAVGCARAIRSFEDDGIVLCSIDARAAAQGALFEAVSDAVRERLPVLFVLQAAGEAALSDASGDSTFSHEFQGLVELRIIGSDGTNIFDAWQAMEDAVDYVRSGAGPALLHAACARADDSATSALDPPARYRHWLLDSAAAGEEDLAAIEKRNRETVDASARRAKGAPDPDPSSVQRGVFADDTHVCPLSNEDFSRLMAKHAGELDTVTLREAIARSITDEFRRNPSTVLLSQSPGIPGTDDEPGLTAVMQREFGDRRVMRLPYSAAHLIGSAAGFCRYRDDIWTVVETTPNDPGIPAALQEIIAAAEASWRSNGRFTPNILLRLAPDGTNRNGSTAFRNIDGMLAGIPGVRIVTPAFADDAAGLLRCAFRTRGLTVFLESASLRDHDSARSLHPSPDLCVPIGRARVRREGGDLSIITYGSAVHHALRAAEALSAHGIDAEVVDLRSILPFDTEAIEASVRRTGRALVLHEAPRTGGFGGEIAAWIGEHCFDNLDAPVRRLTAPDIPQPPAGPLADAILPGAPDIEDAARALTKY